MLCMKKNCDTKYPIFLIHGVGCRDGKRLKYWGRISAALEKQGAMVFCGHQDGWGTVEHNAKFLKARLEKILAETNCEKVNIIAHSKGGLDTRYMISTLGMADYVASLTTVATPHRGSKTIDLLFKLPNGIYKFAGFFVDSFFRMIGDTKPDFYTACKDFQTSHMSAFNKQNPDASAVYYQSYAAAMKSSFSDIFLFFPHFLIRKIEGENDGLVAVKSAKWANFKGILRSENRRGISHLDEIDMRRTNLARKGSADNISDIRRFYVRVVAELRRKGL
jgi:Predicted acetyltransferases and hydrolases with the alpha/beta hydrolase fold